MPHLPALRERLGVRVEPGKIAGVPVFIVTPAAPKNAAVSGPGVMQTVFEAVHWARADREARRRDNKAAARMSRFMARQS